MMVQESEKPCASFLACLLYAVSLVYTGIVTSRAYLYKHGVFQSKKLPCTVISIGNLAVGGTGKTPLTMYIAQFLSGLGQKVAIISRGYGGGKEGNGGVVTDGHRICMDQNAAGDEPYLMAQRLEGVPVLIGKNRYAAGMFAVKEFKSQILLLDDGFQHLQIYRDLNLLLLDATRPFGNGYLLPRGVLRESMGQLCRGDVVILTRSDGSPQGTLDHLVEKKLVVGKRVFRCRHVPMRLTRAKAKVPLSSFQGAVNDMFTLRGRRVLAFSGIARNDSFQSTVSDLGCTVTTFLTFPDHHPYSRDDIDKILQTAAHHKVEWLLTTEKDYVRLAHHQLEWPLELLAIGIDISFGEDQEGFHRLLTETLPESASAFS